MNEYYVSGNIAYVYFPNCTQRMICDKEDWDKYKHLNWCCTKGYVQTSINRKTVKFYRLIMDAPENMEVDHINRNPLDNRKSNLRIISHVGNMANVGSQKKSKTGVAGVYWHKHRNKYFAELKVGKKRYCLGAYKTLEEAAEARKKAEEKYRKPFLEKETLS